MSSTKEVAVGLRDDRALVVDIARPSLRDDPGIVETMKASSSDVEMTSTALTVEPSGAYGQPKYGSRCVVRPNVTGCEF